MEGSNKDELLGDSLPGELQSGVEEIIHVIEAPC